MTENEAINELLRLHSRIITNNKENKAIGMAIKALEQQPCEDCISREAVLEIIEKEEFKGDAIYGIERLPSVQPTRPTARWERLVDDFKKCSKCGRPVKFYRNYKHCPDCGAKMEEVEE